jgi:ribosomal protein S18 acetylase RimI-like enzyme
MIIRPATMVDLPILLTIERLAYASPWTEEHFRYELEKNPYASVILISGLPFNKPKSIILPSSLA